VDDFLATRKYNRPKKSFAQDIVDQLGRKLHESLSGTGENEESFERQDMVRHAPELAERWSKIYAPRSGPSVIGVIRETSVDRELARQSHEEEVRAVKDYGDRAEKVSDPDLRKAMLHARGEEKEHRRELAPFTKGKKS
jgi:hypothetical protein